MSVSSVPPLSLFDGKRCCRCGEWKPYTEFSPRKNRPDGHYYNCKACGRIADKAYYAANREKKVERRTEIREEWKQRDPEGYKAYWQKYLPNRDKEKYRENNARFRANNPDYKREWREQNGSEYFRNKPYYQAWLKEYHQSPRGKEVAFQARHRRRQRLFESPVTLSAEEWETILRMQGHRCLRCLRAFSEDAVACKDHIVPLSQGGGLTFQNTQGLCRSCNSSKADRFICYRPDRMLPAPP